MAAPPTHLSREAGGRAQVRQAPPTWEPRGSPSARRPHRALPAREGTPQPGRRGDRSCGPGEGGRARSRHWWRRLRFCLWSPRWSAPKGRQPLGEDSRTHPSSRRADAERRSLPGKPAPPRTKGSQTPYGEPERPSPAAAPQTRSSAGDVSPAPPTLAFPACPAAPARPLPGFSPASAEEVAEESVRTLGSL